MMMMRALDNAQQHCARPRWRCRLDYGSLCLALKDESEIYYRRGDGNGHAIRITLHGRDRQ